MAIYLNHDDQRLVIEARDESTLFESVEFRNLLFSFSVRSRDDGRIILDVSPQALVESVVYIRDTVNSLGVDIELSTRIAGLIQAHEHEEGIIARQRSATNVESQSSTNQAQVTSCPDIVRPLFAHQLQGLNKGLTVENFAEFSVQGSGKTTTALAAFSTWRSRGEISKLLVIGPLSCFQPWEDEIEQVFVSPLKTLRWSGSMAKRMSLVDEYNRADVVLCSYDTAWRDVAKLGTLLANHRTMLVLDESHYIKNFDGSVRGNAALQLGQFASKRWIMSGTPSPHSLQDLWTQFQFLWPSAGEDLLGNQQQFLGMLESPNPAQEIRSKLQPFFHRTTQSDLGLPEPEFHSELMSEEYLSPEQLRIIRLLEIRIAREVRSQLHLIQDQDLLDRWRKARIIRLLQAASNPALLLKAIPTVGDGVIDVDMNDLTSAISRFALKDLKPAKVKWAIDRTTELVAKGQKVLIWTGWVDNIHYVADLLKEFNPLLIYGGIKPFSQDENDQEEESRENNIRRFKNNDHNPVLIANPAAAAESISLHMVCHDAIYIDRTFNCGQWLQSLNRIHRVGLPANVTTNYWVPFIDCAVERSVDLRLKSRAETMFEFLGDDALAMAINWEEEGEISDDRAETEVAFGTIVQQIDHTHQG